MSASHRTKPSCCSNTMSIPPSPPVPQYAWFGTLNQARQCALVDLMFNIGATKFRGFKRMIAALEQGDYAAAAGQLRSSAWASQVQPSRRDRVVHQLATGANA
jgi:hypothetical protein